MGAQQRRLFLGCFTALIATAFGFAVRGAVLQDLAQAFNLSNEQLGYLGGVGLFPFAISIILLSLVSDKIGYGPLMVFAFLGHAVSTVLTIYATSFEMLYWATFLFALANGAVEAVINPVVATMNDKDKTRWLNILHAGWPGGLVLGGLLAIAISWIDPASITGPIWRWQMAIPLIPTLVYGSLLLGQRFPAQERVAAGVSYLDMLREFGWGSAYICFFLMIAAVNQILVVANIPEWNYGTIAAMALVPTAIFAAIVKSFGRPMFVFLLLVMFLLATTELGTDSWIADIMRSVLRSPTKGTLFLVYTSLIMFVLRFFAGPIVHRISPLGLLATCAAIASAGLIWLGNAGSAAAVLFAAATLYGVGKTFFWPTTLGVVSEQFPKGGALMLNAIAGVGMIAVGTLGNPAIGFVQDKAFDQQMTLEQPKLHERVVTQRPGLFGTVSGLDQTKFEQLDEQQKESVETIVIASKQSTLTKIALLPAIMCLCYLGLIAYFQAKGGYRPQSLEASGAEKLQ